MAIMRTTINSLAGSEDTSLALLRLMYLVSPALPVGAYAYSQGQEYAVDACWLKDGVALQAWLGDVMRYGLGRLDVPVLKRLYIAWTDGDDAQVNQWNDFLFASRETRELLLEDEQLGLALGRVLETHGISEYKNNIKASPSFATLFALAASRWGISVADMQKGYVWAWLENQVSVAAKTVPLGQTQAQKLLMQLMPLIPEIIDKSSTLQDDDIGGSLPGLALASSLHERQYSRLFRS